MNNPKLPEEVLNWLYFANEDYISAEIMMKEKIYNKVCFLSQRAIEKVLKAFLLDFRKEIKKTHKIVDLIAECAESENEFKQFEEYAIEIDRYYIPTRHPDAVVGSLPEGLPKEQQAKSALEITSNIIKFVNSKLQI